MIGYYYNAAGNTFLVVDNFKRALSDDEKERIVLKYVSDKDGVIFVQDHFMDYFNRDGKRANFCGNGARTYFAYMNYKYKEENYTFESYSGKIDGFIKDTYYVSMPPVKNKKAIVSCGIKGTFLEVGVPHFVIESDTENIDWEKYVPVREELDSNINVYSEISPDFLRIRTYERGVEGETGACGSGSTATAYCYSLKNGSETVKLRTNGGILKVLFNENNTFLGGDVERCSEELELQL